MKKTRLLALIITIAMIVGLPITVISSDMGLAEDNHLCNGTHTVDESGFAVNVDGNVTYGYYSDDNIAIEIEVERFAEKYSSQIERYENTDIQGEVNVNIEYYDSEIAESNILDSYPSEVYELIDLMRDSEISSVSKSSRIGVNSTAAGNCNPCVSSGTKIATSTIRVCVNNGACFQDTYGVYLCIRCGGEMWFLSSTFIGCYFGKSFTPTPHS